MNYNFFAYKNDIKLILDFIFNELELQVYDRYSEIGKELLEYKSTADVLAHNGTAKSSLQMLSLYHDKFGLPPNIRTINLNSGKCRYATEGIGLISLHFGHLEDKGLQLSNLIHFTEKGAKKVASADRITQVHWQEINKVSRKLKQFIDKKLSVQKIGKYAILDDANQLLQSGVDLRCSNLSLQEVI